MSLAGPARRLEDIAHDLVELIDVLGIGRCDLLGFSWGTLPLLALLALAPQRVRRAGLAGPMLPVRFLAPPELAGLKPDVRQSLRMVERAPGLHRALMAAVCRLPVSVLMRQFEDEQLSESERRALGAGSAFRAHFADCIRECVRTGSGFFTAGWRMLLDAPGYRLADLAAAAARVDLRLYVGERDNVHLPAVARRLVEACAAPLGAGAAGADAGTTAPPDDARAAGVFRRVAAPGPVGLWMAPGAGRLACALHLQDALDHLLDVPPGPARDADRIRTGT